MKRVLIVDDAIELGRMLQDALKTAYSGIPITVVPSAEEALLESTRYSYDLLVADLRLPGMSGVELIRKIRVRQPNIKVILITALVPEDRLYRQKDEVNPDFFMRKPITISVFLEAVDKLIGEQSHPAEVPQNVDPVYQEMASVLPGKPVEPKTTPLRKGTGILAAPGGPAPTPAVEGLSGIISRLRSTLGAHSAILLDQNGHPVEQAGDLAGLNLENQLVPPILASLSSGAKVSYLLGQSVNQSVSAFRGVEFDLVVAPVGQYTLMLAFKAGRSALRLALAFEEALTAQAELLLALEAMGLHLQSVKEVGAPDALLLEMGMKSEPAEEVIPPEILETPLGQDPSLSRFEELFERKKTGQLRLEDPDTFWDSVISGENKEAAGPGVLTFEQAQKLGLLPSESKEGRE